MASTLNTIQGAEMAKAIEARDWNALNQVVWHPIRSA